MIGFSINYDSTNYFNKNFTKLLQGENWLNILSICCFVLMQLASLFNQKWLKIFILSQYWLNSEMQKSYYNLEEARKWKGLAHCVSEHSKFKNFSYEVLVADMLSSSILRLYQTTWWRSKLSYLWTFKAPTLSFLSE